MKKIFAVILFLLYLTASSGAIINFHYCMGKFIGWDVTSSFNKTCTNCSMIKENRKGCCNDKHATLQLKKDQLASANTIVPHNQFIYILTHYPSFSSAASFVKKDTVQSIHGPSVVQGEKNHQLGNHLRCFRCLPIRFASFDVSADCGCDSPSPCIHCFFSHFSQTCDCHHLSALREIH